jgi:redox-sensitive bicupin YhaK (pirin superfamily)
MRMPKPRKIAGIHRGAPVHWVGDGFRVSTYFPSGSDLDARVSPFLLMDYQLPYDFPPTPSAQRGVGPHPHRGFETVTLVWEGCVAHHDNAGNTGIIGPGDIQWMTAGSGLLHKEYHEREFARRGGRMHGIQLWVNLPRVHKMHPPRYQALTAAQIGQVELRGGAGFMRVIAGESNGIKGPAMTFTAITLLDLRLNALGHHPLLFPEHHNTLLLVMSGRLTVNQQSVGAQELVSFANAGEEIQLTAQEDAHLLVLSGEPIDEPVVFHGPFVMNTEDEIMRAISDFNGGRFGRLPEPT